MLWENESGKVSGVSPERASGARDRHWAPSRPPDFSSVVQESRHLRKLEVLPSL